ncbi:MAG: HAMP domain-containing protein, partial [Acidobacteriota bacterium]
MKPSRAAGGRLFKAFRTLRWKLTFSASAAMVAAIAVLTLVLVVQSSVLDQRLVESSPLEPVLQRETERLADDLEARLAREGALTASAAESWLQDHQSLAERGLTAPVVSPEGMARPAIFEVARLSVFDASGRLLGDLPGAQCAVNDPLPAGVVARVASLLEPGGAPLPARAAGAPIATAVAVYGGDERLVGAVALVASPQPLRLAAVAERASRILPGVLTDGAPAALLVALLIGVLSTRGLIRRLQRLRDASQAWATGDLSRRVADPSADELGEVSRSLDDMAQKVSTLLDAR